MIKALGRRLYKEEVTVLYDGNCGFCRTTMGLFRFFDVFGRIIYVNALDTRQVAGYGLEWLDPDALMTDMHVVKDKKVWKGFSAYRVLASRIPLFWLVWPFLYVWPVPLIGNLIYRRMADSRVCDVVQRPVKK